MLQPQQRFTAMKEDHVTEARTRTECLDERVAPIGLITRQRLLQLSTIVTILSLEKGYTEIGKRIAKAFRIPPFEDAWKGQLVRGHFDHCTVSRLPCCRDGDPDLSGG